MNTIEYGSNTQIISLYDSNSDITIDAVAQAFGMETESVKLVLLAGSQRYKKEVNEKPELFSQADEDIARATLRELCYAENEGVRAKVALAIIDERKGRRDVTKAAKTVGTVNINLFNTFLQQGRERLKEVKGEAIAA